MLTARAWHAALALLLVAGCARRDNVPAHARVACAGCHRGGAATDVRGTVPDASCSSGQCHPTGGPDSVRFAMVALAHTRHAAGDSTGVRCAACHRHAPGNLRLDVDPSACALCHFSAVAGKQDAGCATCHPNPRHTRTTSQGLALPHALLQNAHVPCTRCHYQLVSGDPTVSRARCTACHGRAGMPAPDTTAAPAAVHARHAGYACSACHEKVTHRVVAMSSSIEISCLDCHAPRHRRPIPADTMRASPCASCHAGVHQEQQRLVLGLLPGDSLRPSSMFMGGVTCRSCHAPPGHAATRPGQSLRTTPAACVGCHGGAWDGVLARWRRGYERRRGWIRGYLDSARTALGDNASEPARSRLREATALLAFVDRARPAHNLPVADRVMRHALALAVDAYRKSGREPPPPPNLGPAVESGTCLTCHYGIEEAPIGRDSTTGQRTTHADHLFRAGLTCDACHAPGAAPPGFAGTRWMDTTGAGAARAPSPPPRRTP